MLLHIWKPFWGYFWPAVCHSNVPPQDEWTSNYHGGLKEFIDHAISVLGRTHLKPTTEFLRGVVTYPTGDSTQGRFKMTLSDLQNEHYTVAVREAMMDLILGRTDNNVKVGDVVEMLLSISFGVKDSMLDWTWLGINPKEWPPQRLDWEMYRLEHLAFASNMEAEMIGWINYPWHVLYSALRWRVKIGNVRTLAQFAKQWPVTMEALMMHGPTSRDVLHIWTQHQKAVDRCCLRIH